MCKKSKSLFKQRLAENKGKTINGEKPNSIVEVSISEKLIVSVDRGTFRVSDREIKEVVTDLFRVKRNFAKQEKINLYDFCDCMYNLRFAKGIIIEDIKRAYFTIC